MITMLITELLVGLLIIVIGITNIRGNISTIHSYHRHRVAKEDEKPFGKLMGTGSLIIGVGIIINGIINYIGNEAYIIIGIVILFTSIIIGAFLCVYAMNKYNKGIF